MARITVEDCLEVVDNRFELVMMAAKRARQLANGVEPQLDNSEANDKPTVLALREIAARRIDQPYIDAVDQAERERKEREALESRMRNRGQDSEATIARRLAAAREEMSHYDEFDFVIVNEDFPTAVREMQAIFVGSRQRRHVQQERHAALIAALLAPA